MKPAEPRRGRREKTIYMAFYYIDCSSTIAAQEIQFVPTFLLICKREISVYIENHLRVLTSGHSLS